jgi:hypothetical protein
MSYEEEDACMSYEEEDTCNMCDLSCYSTVPDCFGTIILNVHSIIT